MRIRTTWPEDNRSRATTSPEAKKAPDRTVTSPPVDRSLLIGRPSLTRIDARPTTQSRMRGTAGLKTLAVALLVSTSWPMHLEAQPDRFQAERYNMVENQIRKRGVKQPGVLSALKTVPRHLFVPEPQQPWAYEDAPISFAPGQNLPHALLSARMIEALEIDKDDKVLEVGTGSGYDAALLSRVAAKVYSIEIDSSLGNRARKILHQLGFDNVEIMIGDGYSGWPEKGPFDAILVTVSTPKPPPPLYEQLAMGGRMIVAVGDFVQEMQLIIKTKQGPVMRPVSLVNLGPMTRDDDSQD